MADVFLQTIFDDVRQALDAGDADLAIGMAEHLLHYAPAVIEGHRLLGEAYLHDGQFAQAITAYQTTLRADPENIAAYYGLGLAQQSLHRPDEAIRAFERALEIQPNLAELRTQLLRLYAETPNSAGQFRLSRSGLGRLYARGQMYSQAIDEFYAVLDNDPERNDVRVALAETLWRDGQEDEAVEWCRATIAHQPDLHKPTLILGYLQLAAGQPEGETLWRKAAAQEPSLATAQMLFEVMPPTQIDEPAIPAFDEQVWRAARNRAAAGVPLAASAVTAPDVTPIPQPATTGLADESLTDNDLLASLLGLEADEIADLPPALDEPVTAQERFDAAPDTDARAGGARTYPSVSPSTRDEAEATAEPAQDDALGLLPVPGATTGDQTYITRVLENEEVGAEAEPFPFGMQQRPADGADFGHVEPFTLDWDLPDETPQPAATTPPPSADALASIPEFSDLKPFSLDDLPADDASAALPPDGGDTRRFAAGIADEDETTEQTATGDEPASDNSPFSLHDLGLSETDINDVAATPAEAAQQPPISGEDTTADGTDAPTWSSEQSRASTTDQTGESDSFALESSLDDWLNGIDSSTTTEPTAAAADAETDTAASPAPPSYSFADLDLVDSAALDSATDIPPSSEPTQDAAAPSDAEPFAATPFSLSDLESEDEPTTEATPAPEAAQFWLDDVDQDEQPATDAATPAEPRPFSLADLGLTEDEPTSYPFAQSSTPFALSDPDLEDAPPPTRNSAGLTPFSLADLGLDDEPPAPGDIPPNQSPSSPALGGTTGEQTSPSDASASTPFSLADLGLTEEELERWELQADDTSETDDFAYAPYSSGTTDEEEITPFSLADLGLTEEDIERFGAEDPDALFASSSIRESAEASTTDDVTPFSLADFGLDEDTLAAFGSEEESATAEETAANEPASIHTAETQPFDVAQILAATAEPADGDTSDETDEDLAVPTELERFYTLLETQPENHTIRLALARMNEQQGHTEQAIVQYRRLIQRGALLDPIIEDLQELTGGDYEHTTQRRIHRLLGDAYMKQNRMEEAMTEYSWGLGGGS